MIYRRDPALIERQVQPFFIDQKSKLPIRNEQCIFFDCETVAQVAHLSELPEALQGCFRKKMEMWTNFRDNEYTQQIHALYDKISKQKQINPTDIQEENHKTILELYEEIKEYQTTFSNIRKNAVEDSYIKQAGLFPEYGKIIIISMRFWIFPKEKGQRGKWTTISLVEDRDENGLPMGDGGLLLQFAYVLANQVKLIQEAGYNPYLFAHNGLLFDVPFITKRFFINNITPPTTFHTNGAKPWEKCVIDTRDEWRVGDKNGDNALHTVLTVMNIPTSKDDISGSEISGFYHSEEFDMDRVVTYCEKDVLVLQQLFEKFQNFTAPKTS